MSLKSMFVNPGVEVNIARQALAAYMSDDDARALIPSEGGYIMNLFSNERGSEVETWIEAVGGAIADNREKHREYEYAREARSAGKIVCASCNTAYDKSRMVRAYTSWGNTFMQATCPHCGATD